jgi:hypothetical protein
MWGCSPGGGLLRVSLLHGKVLNHGAALERGAEYLPRFRGEVPTDEGEASQSQATPLIPRDCWHCTLRIKTFEDKVTMMHYPTILEEYVTTSTRTFVPESPAGHPVKQSFTYGVFVPSRKRRPRSSGRVRTTGS